MRVIWTPRSLRNPTEVSSYVAREDAAAADSLLIRIRSRVETLPAHPHQGRMGRIEPTRELAVAGTSYIVVYEVDRTVISIVAVVHSARRWPTAF